MHLKEILAGFSMRIRADQMLLRILEYHSSGCLVNRPV